MKIAISSNSFQMPHDIDTSKFNIVYAQPKNGLRHEAYDADGIIAGSETYDIEFLNKCTNLKVISRAGIGIDNINIEHALKKNIKIFTTQDEPVESVAELTIGQIISLFRNIHKHNNEMHYGKWHRYNGFNLKEKTIGILGYGRIGSKVHDYLKVFGANVIYNDIIETRSMVSLEYLFANSNLVTIHIPLTFKNYRFVNFNLINIMKPGSFIINNSRGPVLDEHALCNALKDNHLAGAALDVFDKEPYYGELTKINNVILTPHIAAHANYTRDRMDKKSIINCIDYFLPFISN